MAASIKSAPYTLTLTMGLVDRTAYWKNEDRREPANVWWLTGGGLSRPATDVEIAFWQMQGACGAPFEYTSATCELAKGHNGMHLTRVDGAALLRPHKEWA